MSAALSARCISFVTGRMHFTLAQNAKQGPTNGNKMPLKSRLAFIPARLDSGHKFLFCRSELAFQKDVKGARLQTL